MGTTPEMSLYGLVKQRFDKLQMEGWIEKIERASRHLCSDLSSEVAALNAHQSSFHWYAEHNEHGPFIRCRFSFARPEDALVALNVLHLLQERVDHHAASTLSHFKDLDIELCTHQPKWGVTQVDLAFAQALTAALN